MIIMRWFAVKDFPLFDTEYGIASLVLKEIPYKGIAYIILREVWDAEELLKECVSFCRMAGADIICATGHEILEGYPLYTTVFEMRGEAIVDAADLESLFPVTEGTVARWREIYNEEMRDIDNAATLTAFDEKRILESGGAYFVHQAGELLGIGWLDDTELLAVAAVKPGAGCIVMNTLMSLIEGDMMRLEVASTNEKAIHLYEKLGFLKTKEISRWYRAL
jgi:GNAT superfamily N-acetyltransferase